MCPIPSSYYGMVGLALASIAGCGWLMSSGTSFAVFWCTWAEYQWVLFVSGSGALSRDTGGTEELGVACGELWLWQWELRLSIGLVQTLLAQGCLLCVTGF